MTSYVGLLRAVNVGGTGKLPMTELQAMAARAGFTHVRTYIASGNCVFESDSDKKTVQAILQAALAAYAGKPVGVLVRTGAEMRAVLHANPFADRPPAKTMAIFLDAPPPADAALSAKHVLGEEIALGRREIYVFYPDGAGQSKLSIPAARHGTARNINTVTKLAEMAEPAA